MRSTRLTLMIYMLFAGGVQLQAAEHPERGLLIFLDQDEKEYADALTDELFIALAQKPGPILVSTSLLKNAFSEYGKNIYDASYENLFQSAIAKSIPQERNRELIRLFKELRQFQYKQLGKKYIPRWAAYKYISLKAIRFNPKEWVIKKVNKFLHLLIPYTYLQNQTINIQDVLEYNPQTISDTELMLGLRINHMETVTIENILQIPEPASQPHYVIKTLYDEASGTSDIFCVREEYLNRSIAIPVWTILIDGHGKYRSEIATIKIHDFKKLLHFLEHKILCKLLVYDTCYSGGINIQEVYQDTTRNLQNTYSFPIIMHALTDAGVRSATLHIELNRNNYELQVINNISFTSFLQAAKKADITDYTNVVKYIFKLGQKMQPNDAPQIKMPGLEWFSILDKDQVIGIGHILASSRNFNSPLKIVTFFKKDPRILLLYASDIPFTLELNPHLEAIVSMIPGNALHRLAGIWSDTKSINTIINMFMKIKETKSNKLFFIREIKTNEKSAQDVLIIHRQEDTSTDDSFKYIAYYIYDNQLFVQSDTKDNISRIATAQEVQEYQQYVQLITGNPQYIKRATYHHNVLGSQDSPPITFPGPLPLGKYAIIEAIEVPSGTILSDIIDAIILMQPIDAVTLIKEVVAPWNDPNITSLKNILYDEKNNKLFFTLNGVFFSDNGELSDDYMPHYMKILTQQGNFPMLQGSLLPTSITSANITSIKEATSPEKRQRIQAIITMLQKGRKRKRDDD